MNVKVELSDWDIFHGLVGFNYQIRTGVLIKLIDYFDNYESWQEEEKQEAINKVIDQINAALTLEHKRKLISFMERLSNKLKEGAER